MSSATTWNPSYSFGRDALTAKDKYTEVRIRRLHKMCGCGGEFICTGSGFSNNAGSFWAHKCDKCGKEGQLRGSWPQLVYEDVTARARRKKRGGK